MDIHPNHSIGPKLQLERHRASRAVMHRRHAISHSSQVQDIGESFHRYLIWNMTTGAFRVRNVWVFRTHPHTYVIPCKLCCDFDPGLFLYPSTFYHSSCRGRKAGGRRGRGEEGELLVLVACPFSVSVVVGFPQVFSFRCHTPHPMPYPPFTRTGQ